MIFKDKKILRKASRSGFTVVEVLIASSIMLISVLAVTNAFSYSRRTVSRTEDRLACLHIAREGMETLRNESYDSTLLTVGNNKVLPGYTKSRGYYQVTETISPDDGSTKDVTVVIKWGERIGSKTNSVSLMTTHSRGLHR